MDPRHLLMANQLTIYHRSMMGSVDVWTEQGAFQIAIGTKHRREDCKCCARKKVSRSNVTYSICRLLTRVTMLPTIPCIPDTTTRVYTVVQHVLTYVRNDGDVADVLRLHSDGWMGAVTAARINHIRSC